MDLLKRISSLVPRYFLSRQEAHALEKRVLQFEKQTGTEIVFHFRRDLGAEPIKRNQELFYKFKLHETTDRAGILVTVATFDHQVAIWADEGVIRRSDDELWKQVIEAMTAQFKQGEHFQGLVAGMDLAEATLKTEQPKDPVGSNIDELPNKPVY